MAVSTVSGTWTNTEYVSALDGNCCYGHCSWPAVDGDVCLSGSVLFNIPETATVNSITINSWDRRIGNTEIWWWFTNPAGTVISNLVYHQPVSGTVITLSTVGLAPSAFTFTTPTSSLTPTILASSLGICAKHGVKAGYGVGGDSYVWFDYITVTLDYETNASTGIVLPPSINNPPPTLQERAIRLVSGENLLTQYNHRFRGARESNKFNLAIQTLQTQFANSFLTLRSKFSNLENDEAALYPSVTEIAAVQHVREQLKFKEWLKLKDGDVSWFE